MKIGSSAVCVLIVTLVTSYPLGEASLAYCSPRDVELLTLVAGAEARGANEGTEYVIYVILNRVGNPRWPDTIEEVVRQPLQFATAHIDDRLEDLLNHPNHIERAAWRRVHKIASEVACGDGEQNPIPDVYHFLAPREFGMRMDPVSRRVVDVGTGPGWALGMYVHPISDGLKHWFLIEKPDS